MVSRRVWRTGEYQLSLGSRTLIMGVVNVTPDSFSDGGLAFSREAAVSLAQRLVEEGADIIDVGGESTRPGSTPVPMEEEIRRVIPVIGELAAKLAVPLSVDTYKAEVARRALAVGASIVNDISGGTFDPDMPDVVAQHRAGVVLMHIKGTPRTMQENPQYGDVVSEVAEFLTGAVERFKKVGVPLESIIVDPGIGFGKRLEHNLQLLRNIARFQGIAAGVLVGPSRKSFIGAITGLPVEQRLEGTIAAAVVASLYGADVVRVHDVAAVRRALLISDAIKFASMASE